MAFLITGAVLVLMAGAIRQVLPVEGRVTVPTWVFWAAMAHAVILVLFPRRLFPPDRRLVLTWWLGLTPAFFGYAGVLNGSPSIVMWVGVALSLGLVAFVLVTHDRS